MRALGSRIRGAVIAGIVASALAACASGGGAGKPKVAVGPPIDDQQARKGASDLVTEIYETLGRGNKDSLFTLLDTALIVFGPRRTDMLGTRADTLVALGQIVDPKGHKAAIRPGKLELVTSPGGRSALAFDVANVDGKPVAVMAVLSNAADLWLVSAVVVAQTPAAQQVKAELAKGAVVPPGAAGTRKQDPAARAAVERFQRGLLDQAQWGADLMKRDDAIVVGPTSGELARGSAIDALWQKRVEAKTRAAVSGEITAAVTDDGQLAWVSAPLTRVERDDPPLPLRVFAVYRKAGAEWRLIALHESIALAEPGAGASFARIVPPKPAEPKPVEVAVAKEPKPAGKPAEKPVKKQKAKAAVEPQKEKAEKAEKSEKAAKPEKKKKKKKQQDDDDDQAPRKRSRKALVDTDEEEAPRKKAKAKAKAPADDEEEAPRKKKEKKEKKEKKKKAKAKAPADDDDQEEAPRKKKKAKAKAKPAEAEDDDVVEISD